MSERLADIYRAEYSKPPEERGEPERREAKRDMAAALHQVLEPESVLDVGCGRGWWLEYWLTEHPEVVAYGYDGCANLIRAHDQCSELVEEHLRPFDLRRNGWHHVPAALRDSPGLWDLVLCVEVAEHLEERCAPQLVRGLSRLGRTVFFSAAPPGRDGVHHVNCRPRDYWRHLFELEGCRERRDLRRRWQGLVPGRGRANSNVLQNAMFFTPKEGS